MPRAPKPRSDSNGATIHAVGDKPKRPKMDSGDEFEAFVRPIFVLTVGRWFKAMPTDAQPDKDTKGDLVDNLTASFTGTFESLADAATDSYLSTVEDLVDVECPKCGYDGEEEPFDERNEGELLECPRCKFIGKPEEFEEDPDEPDDPDGGEPAVAEEPPARRRRG